MFERLSLPSRDLRWAMSGGAAGSLALHGLVLAVALALISGNGPPPGDEQAAITVFVQPTAPPVATASESRPEPPTPPTPPQPELQEAVPPPPEESLAPPDFSKPPPPRLEQPPRPPPLPPRPAPPRSQQAQPAAPAAPAQPTAAAPSAAPPATSIGAPSIAPGWNALLAAWLAAHKSYPAIARQRSEEGDVSIHFTVEADGRVSEVSVVKGSGFADLDQAALAMLRGATVPPPGQQAERTVRIRFHLDN